MEVGKEGGRLVVKGRAPGAGKRCPSGFTSPFLASSYSLSSTHQPPQFLECITLRQGPREDPAHNRCSATLLTESWGPWEGPEALICVGRRERRMSTPSPGQVISWDCKALFPGPAHCWDGSLDHVQVSEECWPGDVAYFHSVDIDHGPSPCFLSVLPFPFLHI